MAVHAKMGPSMHLLGNNLSIPHEEQLKMVNINMLKGERNGDTSL